MGALSATCLLDPSVKRRTALVSLLAVGSACVVPAPRQPRRRVARRSSGRGSDLLGVALARRRCHVLGARRPLAAICWRRSGRRGSGPCSARRSSDLPRSACCRRGPATCCGRICWRGRRGSACRRHVRHDRDRARARSDRRAVAAGGVLWLWRPTCGDVAGAARGRSMFSASMAGLLAVALLGVLWVVASHPERVGGLVLAADARPAARAGAAAGRMAQYVQRRARGGAAAARAGARDCCGPCALDVPSPARSGS